MTASQGDSYKRVFIKKRYFTTKTKVQKNKPSPSLITLDDDSSPDLSRPCLCTTSLAR